MASADEPHYKVDDSPTHNDESDSTQFSENESKSRTRTSLLDSTEEFEIIDSTGEDDDLRDLPLLETVEGQEKMNTQNEDKEEKPHDAAQNEKDDDWIDVLGKLSFYSSPVAFLVGIPHSFKKAVFFKTAVS